MTNPIAAHIIHTENGKFHGDKVVARQQLDAMVAKAFAADQGLVVHFHGGLVKASSGKGIAKALKPTYEEAGRYPVFFVWESGFFEVLANNLGEIAKDVIFELLWKKVTEMVKRKLLQLPGEKSAGVLPGLDDAQGRQAIDLALKNNDPAGILTDEPKPRGPLTPLSDNEQQTLEMELSMDFQLDQEIRKIANGLRTPAEIEAAKASRSATVQASTNTMMDADALEKYIDRPQPGARGFITKAKIIKAIVTIVYRVVMRYINKRHHGFHATIVEEILRAFFIGNAGQRVWHIMKKDTADSFKADSKKYGGTAFLEALKIQLQAKPDTKVSLVGHSTGAVYIAEFLAAAARMGIDHTFEVVFLAPAITCEKWAGCLDAHGGLISEFRSFAMSDALEKKDFLLKIIPAFYPHSLLYFVSGVVETDVDMPLVGMQRYFDSDHFPDDDFPEIKAVREHSKGHLVWSDVSGTPGRESGAKSHGDFDGDPATLKSIIHMLKGNWT